jgi:hypothetical protein
MRLSQFENEFLNVICAVDNRDRAKLGVASLARNLQTPHDTDSLFRPSCAAVAPTKGLSPTGLEGIDKRRFYQRFSAMIFILM